MIRMHAGAELPLGKFVAPCRQCLSGRPLLLFKHAHPITLALLERLSVDLSDDLSDRRVQLREREELPIAQCSQHASLRDQYRILHGRLGESCQMQVVWVQRSAANYASLIRFIRSPDARSILSADGNIGGRIGLFIWTSVVGFAGLPRLGRISIQRTIFARLPRAARRFEQWTCWS